MEYIDEEGTNKSNHAYKRNQIKYERIVMVLTKNEDKLRFYKCVRVRV